MKYDKELLSMQKNANFTPIMWSRYCSLALCGEAGELANFVKKEWRGDKVLTVDVMKELADVYVYALFMADSLGHSLEECVALKIEELRNRYEHHER
jgi:NTP pyrophosphatase (non-canonical NTP hydrolase)